MTRGRGPGTTVGDPSVRPVVADDLAVLVPFADCTPDQLEHIAGLARAGRTPAGTQLITAGASGDELVLVLSGRLRVRGPSGLDGTLGAGDVVGELRALTGEPHGADVVTTTECELLRFDGAEVEQLLAVDEVRQRLRAVAAARLAIDHRAIVTAASVPVVQRPPRIRGTGAGIRSREQLPARPVRTVVVALLALVVTATVGWVLAERNRTTVVELDDVLAEARADGLLVPSVGATTPAGATAPPAGDPLPATPGPGAVDTGHQSDEAVAVPATTAAPPAVDPGHAPADDAPPDPREDTGATPPTFSRPAAGVYSYATSGSERISIAGASHTYPDETHAVVRHVDGCGWSVQHHVLEEHVDLGERCSDDDHVSVLMRGTEVEFFGQRDSLRYVCDPPARILFAAQVGTTSSGACDSADGDGEARFRGTYVGDEVLTIGDDQVPTAHLSIDYTLSGRARGTSHIELWLDTETGLTIRLERQVDTRARAVWGDVRYQEEATFELLSLAPRR